MIKKRIMVILTVSMFLVSLLPAMNAEKHDDDVEQIEHFVSDEIIVKFNKGLSEHDVNSVALNNGLSVISKSQYTGVHKCRVPDENSVLEIAQRLSKNPYVDYAEPNYLYYTSMIPNDSLYSYQWHLHDISQGGINMEPAWDISTGSGAVVAIADTGINRAGNDLTDTSFVAGYDFVNDDADPTDDNGHGTHCAGTVAQSTNNNIGVCGVAYDASLMPIKVLDGSGSGSVSDIADGIIWATDQGAHIISMSFGGGSPSSTLENAVAYAYNNGVTCVAASGNGGWDGHGDNGVDYPAAYDSYVIAVGATTYLKEKAVYSNYGNSLDVVAPGGDSADENGDGRADGVYQETFDPDWGYYFWQGTSMATPHVAGTAALLVSQGTTNPDDIRNIIQSSAVDLGNSGWDMHFGHGLVNAYNALTYGSGNNAPTADFSYTTSDLTVTFTDQSSDSDGSVVGWSWDFGDGTTSTEQHPTHTYTADGTYTVSLTVTDDDGETDSISQSVPVSSGIILDMHIEDVYLWLAGTAGPWEHIGVQATVFDSNGNPIQGVTVDLSLETPTGSILSDTATTDSSGVAHTVFDKASRNSGLYIGTVTDLTKSGYAWDMSADVESSDTLDTSGGGTTNNPPTADFSYTTSDLTVTFTDQSSDSDGSVVGWSWDFGDGTTSTEQHPTHTYTADGTYTVSLTVTDDDGETDSISQSVPVSSGGGSGTSMYVSDISWSSAGPHLKSLVTIKEDAGGFVGGATVSYTLTNQDTGDIQIFTGTTDSNGQIEVMWKRAPAGYYEGCVTSIQHNSYTYDSILDVDNPDYYTH